MENFLGSLTYDVKLCAFVLKYIVWMKNKHCKDMQVLDKWNSESLLYILYKVFPVTMVSISTFFGLVQRIRSIELTEVSPKMIKRRYFFFALNVLPWKFLLIKKLDIEKNKTSKNTTFKIDTKSALSFFDFKLFF